MKRSKFSLSHYKLFSCDMGELVPCGMFEVLPGDTVQHATSMLVRASALLAPVMHPVHVRIHHWFVPYRLIWDEWEDFITGGPDGLNASEFPTITLTNPAVGSLADYLGIPNGTYSPVVSALPFRAYALIWNEWYRDQDLETKLTIDLTSGADSTTNTTLKNCAWEKDYFTSARPWEQKGAAITIPLGTEAVVRGTGGVMKFEEAGAASNYGTFTYRAADSTVRAALQGGSMSDGDPIGFQSNPAVTDTGLFADLSDASAITVTALREALALQRYEEARARFGSRYVEYLRYLGVRSSDARLQRPEYLGGGRQTIQFSEVLATAETGSTTKVGDLKGHGIGAMRSNRYRRFFEEHGVVISLASVRPKTMYVDGLSRMWNRRTKDEFWQKEFQHIGQQEVLNKEVRAVHATPNGVFGYQDRYDEYRRQESSVGGEFRTSTLNYWHFARSFASDPALNSTFVSCVPTERTFAVSTNDVLYNMANHSIQARRLVGAVGSSFIY